MTKKISIKVFGDPGHAWARFPKARLVSLGIADKITPYYLDLIAFRSLSNLVAERLLESKNVSFAAAVLDHPLKGNPLLTVRAKAPHKELAKAIEAVHEDLSALASSLKKA